jgi:hypothetical protein
MATRQNLTRSAPSVQVPQASSQDISSIVQVPTDTPSQPECAATDNTDTPPLEVCFLLLNFSSLVITTYYAYGFIYRW